MTLWLDAGGGGAMRTGTNDCEGVAGMNDGDDAGAAIIIRI